MHARRLKLQGTGADRRCLTERHRYALARGNRSAKVPACMNCDGVGSEDGIVQRSLSGLD